MSHHACSSATCIHVLGTEVLMALLHPKKKSSFAKGRKKDTEEERKKAAFINIIYFV
jgi:hypothetical protein